MLVGFIAQLARTKKRRKRPAPVAAFAVSLKRFYAYSFGARFSFALPNLKRTKGI
jgi:hypothetical protein